MVELDPSIETPRTKANEELDGIFIVELNIAESIRKTIEQDIKDKKFGAFELQGRLGMNRIQLVSMMTRQTWTLRYAISIANKLGYEVQTMKLVRGE